MMLDGDVVVARERTHWAPTGCTASPTRPGSSRRTRPMAAGSLASRMPGGHFKDAFHEFVVNGNGCRDQSGSAAARRSRRTIASTIEAGGHAVIRLRLSADGHAAPFDGFDRLVDQRRARGRRLLRASAAGPLRRSATGAAAGVRRDDLEQAVLLLRRAAVAERRSRPTEAAGGTRTRPQPRVEAPEQRRHHLDAGQVGVSVVRGLGPRLPHDFAGDDRSRLCEAAAGAADARVVHAPERPAARL